METVRVEVIGDPLKVEVAFRERGEIQLRHMKIAMERGMTHLRDVWQDLAPIGQGRDVNAFYPSWEPRIPGTYRRSIHVVPIEPFGDSFLGAVESDDMPVARVLESGSGLYATGRRSRPKIYPQSRQFLAIPGGQLRVGANRPRKGDPDPGARFLRSVRGQRPQHVMRRARIAAAPYTKIAFKEGAAAAAAEIKAML